MSGIRYLTIHHVREIHRAALSVGPSLGEGIRSEHLLESAVAQPEQTFGGRELYETVALKAAAYGFGLAENQPFVDGNKRTAALVMTVFLDVNGYVLCLDHDLELAEAFESLANKQFDRPAFVEWVQARVVRQP